MGICDHLTQASVRLGVLPLLACPAMSLKGVVIYNVDGDV